MGKPPGSRHNGNSSLPLSLKEQGEGYQRSVNAEVVAEVLPNQGDN